MGEEDIEQYEDDMELRLWQEYRDVLPMFRHAVETERRFYLANRVELTRHEGAGGPWFELELHDAWVWDTYRPNRFVSHVRIISTRDVNIEDIAQKDLGADEALGITPDPT